MTNDHSFSLKLLMPPFSSPGTFKNLMRPLRNVLLTKLARTIAITCEINFFERNVFWQYLVTVIVPKRYEIY